ncbi:MAG TPA: four helix bundle protein [Candidatus Paceibacterota bacterium]
MKSYKELIVWQKSVELVEEIYKLTPFFPKDEIYGISSQMKRAVVSIPSNIAEGFVRKHNKEFQQFIRTAFGSAAELETQLIIAKKLRLAPSNNFNKIEALLNEILKMLNRLISSLSIDH